MVCGSGMTTYAEMVKEFYRRSGLGVAEYAEKIEYSTPQLSNILNDKEPGSWKTVQACMRVAGLGIEDVLTPPDESPDTRDEKKLIRLFRGLTEQRRKAVLLILDGVAERRPRPRREG